jgi:1,4-dihydroxy-6-naphthoate synthase
MWWPLTEHEGQPARIDTGRFRFKPVLADIESLNRRAEKAELEITAISCAQYPQVMAKYALTSCRHSDTILAIPGERTSAFATTCVMLGTGSFRYATVPFEQIIDRVADGEFPAGLIIHEGQLTYEASGLHLIADVGQWWFDHYQLPLPLGVNAIRLDLQDRFGEGTLQEVTGILRKSVSYAMANRSEAIEFAMAYARGLQTETADQFIQMYVNKWTVSFGSLGRQAVQTFLNETRAIGLTPAVEEVRFIEPSNAVETDATIRTT